MNSHSHSFTLPRTSRGINCCNTCGGEGAYWNGRGRGGNDPDSWVVDCADCSGTGHFACRVCGFDVPVDRFDCFVCETVRDLPAAAVARLNPTDLANCIQHAITAAFREAA